MQGGNENKKRSRKGPVQRGDNRAAAAGASRGRKQHHVHHDQLDWNSMVSVSLTKRGPTGALADTRPNQEARARVGEKRQKRLTYFYFKDKKIK